MLEVSRVKDNTEKKKVGVRKSQGRLSEFLTHNMVKMFDLSWQRREDLAVQADKH